MKKIKTVKKSIVSLILVCAMFASVFAVSTVSVSAASAPKLNLVNPKSSGSFDVVWNIVPNAVKYRIYFGTNDGRGNGWRRFTVLNANSCTKHPNYPSFKFTINSSSLTGRTWYKYGDDQAVSTPSLNNNTVYKCQVEALNKNGNHLAWTNVDYAYLAQPQGGITVNYVDNYDDFMCFRFRWKKVNGCDGYDVMGAMDNEPYELEISEKNPNINEYSVYLNPYLVGTYYIKIRACKKISSNRYVYGPWIYNYVNLYQAAMLR